MPLMSHSIKGNFGATPYIKVRPSIFLNHIETFISVSSSISSLSNSLVATRRPRIRAPGWTTFRSPTTAELTYLTSRICRWHRRMTDWASRDSSKGLGPAEASSSRPSRPGMTITAIAQVHLTLTGCYRPAYCKSGAGLDFSTSLKDTVAYPSTVNGQHSLVKVKAGPASWTPPSSYH